jgi:hypothetical protein
MSIYLNKQKGPYMSANQPPFPGHQDQYGQVPSEAANENHFSPPRLRLGLGPMTSPFGLPSNNVAPSNAAWNGEQTQAYQYGQEQYAPQDNDTVQGSTPSSQSNFFGGRGAAPHLNTGVPSFPNADDGTQPLSPIKPAQCDHFNTGAPGNDATTVNPVQFGRNNTGTLGSEPMGFMTGQYGTTGQYGATGQYGTGTLPGNGVTGTLGGPVGEYSGNTGMLKLNQAVKVVKIPIAGRPGEFKTGILPVLSQMPSGTLPPPSSGPTSSKGIARQGKILLIVAMVFIVLVGTASVLLLHLGSGATTTANASPSTSTNNGAPSKLQIGATGTAQVEATATAISDASILVDDPLSSNAHNWITGVHNGISYSFTNGAYHIRQNGSDFGYAIMTSETLPKNYTYSLTMQNVTYDTGNSNGLSFYGLIMNYQSYSSTKASFYLLRVNNGKNISYEFDKFDNRTTGTDGNPWQEIFPDKNNTAGTGQGNGKEFLGPHQANVYSVTSLNGQFTIRVNNKQIGSVKDTSFTGGGLGMGVSQAGSEAAFTNLEVWSN